MATNQMRNTWTESELAFLREHYPTQGAAYVASELGRPITSVRMKASNLSIASQRTNAWTEDEVAIMKKYYRKKGAAYVARRTGRTMKAVIARAIRTGFRTDYFRRWTEHEVRYLRRVYGTKSNSSISRTLGRSTFAVSLKAKKMGLSKPPAELWTEKEKQLLMELYPNPNISYDQIEEQLHRPKRGILKMARKLELDRHYPNWWTKEKRKFLEKNYLRMSYAEIAKKLGVTERAVGHYANRHGLRKQPNNRQWTKEEILHVQENADKLTASDLATALNRPLESVEKQLIRLKQT